MSYGSARPAPAQGSLPLAGENPDAFGVIGADKLSYVQLLPHALDELVEQLGLSARDAALLAWLVLAADFRTALYPCSLTELADHLQLGRKQAAEALGALEQAATITWVEKPSGGRHAGVLRVNVYGVVAANGRRGSGHYVPVRPALFDDWCERRRLPFSARALLLRCVLKANDETFVLGRTVTEVAAKLGVNRRRAATLEEALRGGVRWLDKDGAKERLEVVVFPSVVALSVVARQHRDERRRARFDAADQDFSGSGDKTARFDAADQDFRGTARFDAADQDFRDGGSEGRARFDAAGARFDAAGARFDAAEQGFRGHTHYPVPPPYQGADDAPATTGDGPGHGMEEISSTAQQVLARVAAGWGDRGRELMDPKDGAGRRTMTQLLVERLKGGHNPDELVDGLVINQGGAKSVPKVIITRLREMPLVPLRLGAAGAHVDMEQEARRGRLEQAVAYGRNRGGLVSIGVLAADELDEDLAHYAAGDAELLEVARRAAAETSAAGPVAAAG